ncbi:MAG: Eco57I restriction-modification methylase domain-containing protein [Limisphaerales bacterium]
MNQPPPQVLELIQRFDRNREAYRSPHYNETQLRREFLDPFFSALGWDIENKEGYAEAYKDVVHEDAIKVGEATKAPDYCFRIGGTRKFFLEAKRPSVDIKDDPSPAFQLRRYAWTTKLPLSILTDFEEFAVYDCRFKPHHREGAAIGRILYIPYTEYSQRWEEIAGVFSRDAVLKGSFDKFAESTRAKRGTADVDDEFLKTIEGWRSDLAHNLALRNRKLSQRELNFAVQRIIDRVIFLRICEGRGIEDYGRLRVLTNGDRIYPRLCQIFEEADTRYNSGLFHFRAEKDRHEAPDELTLALELDDKLLRDIIKGLYYPESPYVFSALPADILGQVYEQFLGKVIRLTEGHHAVVEEKPEVKKAGGVYYTPTYIVDYIVQATVGKLLQGKTPRQAAKLKILDPACGSGSFLIGAYECLLKWHRDFYISHDPAKWAKGPRPVLVQVGPGNWKLTIAKRKRILLDNIFGVDIDSQAVETTKLSLLLKVLEGETQQSLQPVLRLFHERALPDLGDNIKCGNSLIGHDYQGQTELGFLTEEERSDVNPFDWMTDGFPEVMKTGGFQVVIGNPPYDVMEKERGASSWPHTALTEYGKTREEYAPAFGGKLNLFRFFVVQSLRLSKRNGRIGMIVPMALLADISCAATRKHLVLSTTDLEADCFPQKDNANRRVFKNAKLSTVVLSATKAVTLTRASAGLTVRVYPWNSFKDSYRKCSLRLEDITLLDPQNLPIPLVSEDQWRICRKLHGSQQVKALGQMKDFEVNRGEINQTIYRDFITDNPRMARLLKGVEVGRFQLRDELKQGCREWFDEKRFLTKNNPKPIVGARRIATQRITGVDERLRVVATIVEPPTYFADSTNSIVRTTDSPYQFEYLLGLLNSKLFQWRFKLTSTNNNVGTNELNAMPIRLLDFSNPTEKSHHDRMVNLVHHMLALHQSLLTAKTPQEKTALERQITAVDAQIDRLVYDLYGLTADEINLVKGATP